MIVYIHQENKMKDSDEPERYYEWMLWKLRQEREKEE